MQATTEPTFFKQGPRPISLLLFYSTISLVLLWADARMHMLQPVREAVSVLLYPAQWLVTEPISVAQNMSKFFATQAALQRENRALQNERLLANAQLLRMQALKQENMQLKALLGFQTTIRSHSVIAEIRYTDRDPFTAKLIIDRGETAGIRPGQVVIDQLGVAGQITRVQPLTSEVRLITDKNQPVPVQIVRNGLRTVTFGTGQDNRLEIRFAPVSSDIRTDDILVTSGIDGTYPFGLPVARVAKVERNLGSAFAIITCEPLADVDKNRYLLILDEVRPIPPHPQSTTPEPSKKSR